MKETDPSEHIPEKKKKKSTTAHICFHVLLHISYLKIGKAYKKNQKKETLGSFYSFYFSLHI